MKYANIDLAVFDQREFLEATHEQIGIWLLLYRYCATQENNGIIVSSKDWPDSHWKRLFNCTREQVHPECPLWRFTIAGALIIEFYNSKAQEFAQRRRATSRIAGQQSTPAKREAVRENGKKGGRPKIIQLPRYGNSNNLT
jgi:hypothetical protein